MHRILVIMIVLIATPSLAAPVWLEREFVRASELIDPTFEEFTPDASETVDHSPWGERLAAYVRTDDDGIARVDHGAISPADLEAIGDYIATLSTEDIAALDRNEQLALWINLYNAATVELVAKNYPVKSIKKIDSAWDKPVASLNGRSLSLNDIEHGIVRPVYNDNRIHYALNCAAVGCPNLAGDAYTGAALDEMLDAAARAYINHHRGVTVKRGKITVSKIYGWYRDDFGKDDAAVLNHIRKFAAPALKTALKDADSINKYVYDWDLNVTQAK